MGSRVDGKFAPAIFRGVVAQKGTQCRGQDRFSSLERRGSRTGGSDYVVTLHERRRVDRATLLPKRCSPLGLGKQRATGLPRGVINHFLLRKARRERKRERRLPHCALGSSRRSAPQIDGLALRFPSRIDRFKIIR